MTIAPTGTPTTGASAPEGHEHADPLLGQLLNGEYYIVALHARGGMSRIYRAEQRGLKRMVAVKVLTLDPIRGSADTGSGSEAGEQLARRFHLEASLLASLQHPNIVTVFDYGRLDGAKAPGRVEKSDIGHFFTVMEYLDGQTLAELLDARGRLPHEEVVCLLQQLLQGLRVAHLANVVHRDLKPSNLMVLAQGGAEPLLKIFDFGIVKMMAAGNRDSDQELTQAGVLVGSPRYMSPEQVLGHEVDQRTDIYAVGLIAYILLTGVTPIGGETTVETMLAQVNVSPLPFAQLDDPPDCPGWLENLVFWCVAKSKDARPQDCEAVLRALKRGPITSQVPTVSPPALAGRNSESSRSLVAIPPLMLPQISLDSGGAVVDPDVTVGTRTRTLRRWPWAAPVAAMGAAVLATLLWVGLHREKPIAAAAATSRHSADTAAREARQSHRLSLPPPSRSISDSRGAHQVAATAAVKPSRAGLLQQPSQLRPLDDGNPWEKKK